MAQQRSTKACATTIIGLVRIIKDVNPTEIQHSEELEIAEREIAVLVELD